MERGNWPHASSALRAWRKAIRCSGSPIALRIVHSLRMAAKRGTIGDGGKRKSVRVWMLGNSSAAAVL